MEKLKHSQKETEKLNKQILELIKQKVNLAQQLEMWEVCLLAYTHLKAQSINYIIMCIYIGRCREFGW